MRIAKNKFNLLLMLYEIKSDNILANIFQRF